MPRFVVPKRSGVHRIASIALFRALLTSCTTLPLAEDEKNTLQNVIRNKFKRNQDVHSKRLLNNAFQAGYEALDLFDTSRSGSITVVKSIREIIAKTPQFLKRPPKVAPLAPKPKRASRLHQPRPEDSILARPRLSVSGKRIIPTLVIANSIPFLRIKKPQPASLSGYIRSRVKQRQERYNRKEAMSEVIILADFEDEWDNMMAFDRNVDTASDALSTTWASEYRADMYRVSLALAEEDRKNKEMTLKFQDIIEEEKELAAAEEIERKAQKKETRRLAGSKSRPVLPERETLCFNGGIKSQPMKNGI